MESFTDLVDLTSLLVVSVCLVSALLVGSERQLKMKPITFGTYTLVCCGSCVATMVAVSLVPANALTLLNGLVSGIGFLGAGALAKSPSGAGNGFLTAALLWSMVMLGMSVGSRNWMLFSLMYAVIWFVLLVNHGLEVLALGTHSSYLVITAEYEDGWWENMLEGIPLQGTLRKRMMRRLHYNLDKTKNPPEVKVKLQVKARQKKIRQIIKWLASTPGVRAIEIAD